MQKEFSARGKSNRTKNSHQNSHRFHNTQKQAEFRKFSQSQVQMAPLDKNSNNEYRKVSKQSQINTQEFQINMAQNNDYSDQYPIEMAE